MFCIVKLTHISAVVNTFQNKQFQVKLISGHISQPHTPLSELLLLDRFFKHPFSYYNNAYVCFSFVSLLVSFLIISEGYKDEGRKAVYGDRIRQKERQYEIDR